MEEWRGLQLLAVVRKNTVLHCIVQLNINNMTNGQKIAYNKPDSCVKILKDPKEGIAGTGELHGFHLA